jgi:hypothetical protein
MNGSELYPNSISAYSKAEMKSSDDKASPYFKPLWIGNISDKRLLMRTLLYVSFKYILITLTSFMDNPHSMRIHKTSLLTES